MYLELFLRGIVYDYLIKIYNEELIEVFMKNMVHQGT